MRHQGAALAKALSYPLSFLPASRPGIKTWVLCIVYRVHCNAADP